MLQYLGIPVIQSNYIDKDKFAKMHNCIVIHPYSVGKLILTYGDYLDVFRSLGINNHSIEACADYAKNKIKNFVNNLNYK